MSSRYVRDETLDAPAATGAVVVMPMPNVPALVLAASVSQCSGAVVSATGVGQTEEEARLRHDAERSERCTAAMMPAPSGITGMAAGDDEPDAVSRRALCEMIERWTCLQWWHGTSMVSVLAPTLTTVRAFSDARAAWPRLQERKTGLLQLDAAGLPSVFVAWSCDGVGRSMCFGAACRLSAHDAALGALRELYQMEFGLALERYRARQGVNLRPASTLILARANGLKYAEVKGRPQPECDPIEQAVREPADALSRAGLRWSTERLSDVPYVVRASSPDLKAPSGHVRWPFYTSANS